MELKYINKDVNPRDDFHKFATDRWIDFNEQPSDMPSWNNFEVLDETVVKQLRDIICSFDSNDKMQKKMSAYYRIYTDYDKRNRERIAPILPYLEHLHNLNDRYEILEWYTRTFVSDLLWSLDISQDLIDSDRYEVWLEQSLVFGNRDYYISNTPDNVGIRQKYRQVHVDLLMMTGLYSQKRAEELFNIFFMTETEIAKCAYPVEKLQKPEENYNRMSIDELSSLIGMDAKTLLRWSDYNDTNTVIVGQPEPVKKAFEFIRLMSVQHLKDLVEYNIVTGYMCDCSEDFGEKAWEFTQYMTGATERTPKWKREVHHMTNAFYEPLGKIFSERYFSEEAKKKVIAMTSGIRDAFREIMKEQEWMSDETKKCALEKLDAMKFDKIGYPDKWEDYSDFPLDESKPLVDNIICISQWKHQRVIKKYYNKQVDKSDWPMMPHEVNACCMQQHNELCFPAAFLQPPFFDINADDASNYGSIGVIIGHEMTHNFDTSGRLFSKNGNMTDWWTETDTEKFNELTKNTKEHFDQINVLPFVKCNGELTLNENIADYGGLKIAYRALEKLMNGRIDIAEPVTGYNWKQRFFISYAQLWAGVATDECIKQQVQNDPHSVLSVRTNGTLPMFTPWYSAWDVKETDKLYINESLRAKIW